MWGEGFRALSGWVHDSTAIPAPVLAASVAIGFFGAYGFGVRPLKP